MWANPDRRHSAWIGGALLARLDVFAERVVTKAEYDENGPWAVAMHYETDDGVPPP